MLINNTHLTYSILTIMSTGKKSFESMGLLIGKSGDTIKRILPEHQLIFTLLERIALWFFRHKKNLVLIIDDTLIHKTYSRYMQGSGYFYDTRMGKTVLSFKLLVAGITDGIHFIPIRGSFLFSKEVCTHQNPSKDTLIKQMILNTVKLFGISRITVVADGAFATTSLLSWCSENGIKIEVRMHSNRKVFCHGKEIMIRSIKQLQPKGRHMSRTTKVVWHGLLLYVTAQRRIDRHGNETIVFLAATYSTKPSKHVDNYKKRWPIEKFFRTAKQHLGLRDCFSRHLNTQLDHVAGVFLGYTFLQLTCKQLRFKTPEESMRHLKHQKVYLVKQRIYRMVQIFGHAYA